MKTKYQTLIGAVVSVAVLFLVALCANYNQKILTQNDFVPIFVLWIAVVLLFVTTAFLAQFAGFKGSLKVSQLFILIIGLSNFFSVSFLGDISAKLTLLIGLSFDSQGFGENFWGAIRYYWMLFSVASPLLFFFTGRQRMIRNMHIQNHDEGYRKNGTKFRNVRSD